MKRPLQTLLVEDNPDDADLVLSELRRAGFDPRWKRVETEADFLAEIKNSPDIILSDYSMPEFNGLRAAELLRKNGSDIPFILISGTVGEDVAVDAMRRGATDYLLKDRLARLGKAVERALDQRRLHDERKQTEAELQRSQKRLRDLIDGVGPSIFVGLMTPQGILIECNRPALAAAGLEPEDVIGKPFEEARWWTYSREVQQQLREAIAQAVRGEASRFDVQVRVAENHLIDVDFSLQPVRNETGEVVFLVPSANVITERKQAEAALRESKRFAESIAENSTSIIYLFDLETGRNAYSNRSVGEFLGYSPAQILALGDNLLPTIIHPEDLSRVTQHFAHFAEVPDSRIVDLEYRVKHASGDWRWTWSRDTVFNRRPNGAAWQILGTAQDITERKRTEESLQLLGTAVEQAKESIVITDADLNLPGPRIVFVNPAFTQMTGYTAEDAIGKTPRILQGMRTDKAVLSRLRHNLERGEVFAGEVINYRKDGTEFCLEWQIAPIRNASGKATHFVAIQRDITAKKQAEFDLEQTHNQLLAVSRQAGMAEFATGILHNVGNVLNSVNVASTCMSDSLKKSKSADLARVVALMRQHEADLGAFFTLDPKGKQIPGFLALLAERLAAEQATALKEMGELQKNVEHIKGIISVQQDSAKMSRSPEALKLTDLIEDALKMNANGLGRGGIQVRKDFEEVPPIMMEKHKVLQILVNLVRNATQACEASGGPEKRLTLRVSQAAGLARIAVTDNGSGIMPEHLSRIFGQGFTTKKDGHGFGLHSAALAAKELGGSLAVQSEGSGRGATFTLELPMKG